MSKNTSYAVDNNGALVAVGLLAVVGTVVGVGLWRRGSSSRTKLVEAKEYRGVKYRIEQLPIGNSVGFLGMVPAQVAGGVEIANDEPNLLGSLEDARRYVQQVVDLVHVASA